jgi:hypothetical protein
MARTQNETKQGQCMTAKALFREEKYDFSLVLGDPVFRFFRKVRLSGDHLEFLYRRLTTIILIVWVPLLLLDNLGPHAASMGRLSFLYDVEVQVRFLIALPVLIWAELIVHSRIRPVIRRLVERGIVREEDLPRFEAAIDGAARLRNSIPVEVALLICIYTLGLWLWNSRFGIVTPTWAHTGVGRVARPIKDHAANLAVILSDPAMKNVYFDISWDEVAKYVVSSPETTKTTADLINRFPDRFLFGTDEAAPRSQDRYLKVFYQYDPLWKLLTPEASEKVRKGNFARLFDEARPKVRGWEAAHKTGSQTDSQPGAHLSME